MKYLVLVIFSLGMSALAWGADVAYPSPITAADSVLIEGGLASSTPAANQVKIGAGRVHVGSLLEVRGGSYLYGQITVAPGVPIMHGDNGSTGFWSKTETTAQKFVSYSTGGGSTESWIWRSAGLGELFSIGPYITTTRAVGIGTATPAATLDVNGNLRIKSTMSQMNGKVAIEINPGSATNSAGLYAGMYHHDLLVGSYLEGGLSRGFISTGYGTGERSLSFGTASGSDFSTATFVPRMTISDNGKIGIGTSIPNRALHVYSTSWDCMKLQRAGGGNAVLEIQNDQDAQTAINFCRADGAAMGQVAYYQGAANNYMILRTNNLERLRIDSAGNVGIGTATPTNALTVNGTISAKEVKVTATGADYVFADDYQLRPLSEVEAFIKQNRHLPEIMPAKEMQEHGMPVSEVVTKQLAKIEELTLYVIALDRESRRLAKENATLRNEQGAVNEAIYERLKALENR